MNMLPASFLILAGVLAGPGQPGEPAAISVSFSIIQFMNDGEREDERLLATLLLEEFAESGIRVLPREASVFTDLPGFDLDNCSMIATETIASPRMLVIDGQEAWLRIGSPASYVVAQGKDCYTIEKVDIADGIELSVTATLQDDGLVRLDPVIVTTYQMIGREGSERVPEELGRPIIKTHEVDLTVTLPKSDYAIMPLPRHGDAARPMGLMIRAQQVLLKD